MLLLLRLSLMTLNFSIHFFFSRLEKRYFDSKLSQVLTLIHSRGFFSFPDPGMNSQKQSFDSFRGSFLGMSASRSVGARSGSRLKTEGRLGLRSRIAKCEINERRASDDRSV
jgi:hypothetical protein